MGKLGCSDAAPVMFRVNAGRSEAFETEKRKVINCDETGCVTLRAILVEGAALSHFKFSR